MGMVWVDVPDRHPAMIVEFREQLFFRLRQEQKYLDPYFQCEISCSKPGHKDVCNCSDVLLDLDAVLASGEHGNVLIWDNDIYRLATSGSEAFTGCEFEPSYDETLWFTRTGGWAFTETVSSRFPEGTGSGMVLCLSNENMIAFVYFLGHASFEHTKIYAFGATKESGITKAISESIAARKFLDTKIASATSYPISRQQRRYRERHKMPIPQIKVVELRMVEQKKKDMDHTNGDSRTVQWSHRWAVNPHWRKQWLPKQQTHSPRFIHSYIKGPASKPFVQKTTVFWGKR